MRFLVMGTSETTILATQALLDSGCDVGCLVSMPPGMLPDNSVDIEAFACRSGIPFMEIEDINSHQSVENLRDYDCDYVHCFWPKILKSEALGIPRHFCVGSHPTALPYNRGRHPLHWLIVLGIKETKLTFFAMDEHIDTGHILHSIPVNIDSDDNIQILNRKIDRATYDGTRELVENLKTRPAGRGRVQNGPGNSWRKRTLHDVTIDFRMNTDAICRLARSFTSPYPCANLIYKNHVIKICEAEPSQLVFEDQALARIEHGRVVRIARAERLLHVKSADSIVKLRCFSSIPSGLRSDMCIHPPSAYLSQWTAELFEQL